MPANTYWINRGNPWEFDPGPPPDSRWAEIFSETPNYRGLSKAVFGSEKFRWHFGPMYYRGRLTPNSVKVMVIGQEGAQDESLAHRSFVGGTGSRMQHFLRFIGIDFSYLLVNTFVYPINGQYGSTYKWLAQNPGSPIVQQRHKLFNYVLETNDVQLIIAVGAAAKESVKTWIESRGGSCPNGTDDVSTCAGSFLDPGTRTVGVLHPGGASKGGSVAEIKISFQNATDKIRGWLAENPAWLPPDPGMTRDLTVPYTYSSSPIPFRDLPLGINWRIGSGATASNRKDNQRSIQAFSQAAKYGNKGVTLSYPALGPGTQQGYSEKTGDVPYEPPVADYEEYDRGPGQAFAQLMMGGQAGLAWPDFSTLGVKAHESFGYGQIYRGRPDSATVLILAQQQSYDDMFLGRALTGDDGQHLQSFLEAIGIRSRYCILRVLPVDTLDLSLQLRKSIATQSQIVKVYQALVDAVLENNNTKLVMIFGSVAAALAGSLKQFPVDTFKLKAWGESGALSGWKSATNALRSLNYPKEIGNPGFAYNGEQQQIPRLDLPYGVLKWQGTSGNRVQRALKRGRPSPDYYKWTMPQWASLLKPLPISEAEQAAVANRTLLKDNHEDTKTRRKIF